MSTSPFASLGGLGGMFDQSAKDEMASIKEEVDQSELVLPGLDEAIAFDELLKHVENPTQMLLCLTRLRLDTRCAFVIAGINRSVVWPSAADDAFSGGIRSMLFGRKQSDAMKEELERFEDVLCAPCIMILHRLPYPRYNTRANGCKRNTAGKCVTQ